MYHSLVFNDKIKRLNNNASMLVFFCNLLKNNTKLRTHLQKFSTEKYKALHNTAKHTFKDIFDYSFSFG